MKITDKVDAIVRDIVTNMGYELDEVEFIKENGSWVLTLYIHSENGISLEDCERVSRAVDPVLDEADPIEAQYFLSVSSIGIDRPLRKNRDFERNIGKAVTLKLYAPIEKKKEFTGTLVSFDETAFIISFEDGKEMSFVRKQVAQVRPYIKF